MGDRTTSPTGIFSLPNEILLHILDPFRTRDLVPLSTICRSLHSLIIRLVHHRLRIAAGLDGHTLYLECHHPSTRLYAPKLFCLPLGTPGLDELISNCHEGNYLGQLEQCGTLFSRFRPQRREPAWRIVYRVPGDIRGSRTHPSDNPAYEPIDPNEVVSTSVTLDAQESFSQLTATVYLGQRESSRGLLSSIKEVCDGTIRVWRTWLSKQCESRSWADGERVPVHHEQSGSSSGSETRGVDGEESRIDPTKDPSILWINTQKQNVGVKFKVKEKQWRRANPVLYASEEEVPVSYHVEYEEVLVRTTQLLLKLEDAQDQIDNSFGKAIIFGSFRG